MNKRIKIFQSIHFKIVIVFVFLLIVALEIIGAYFVGQLETQMVDNFQEQMRLRVGFLDNNLQPLLKSPIPKILNRMLGDC